MALIAAALGGMGKAMQDVGAEGISYLSKSALQSDYMDALKQRDQTLAEAQRQRDTQAQTFTAGENEKNRAQQESMQTERLTQERLLHADQTGLEQMRLDISGGQAQEQARHNKALEVIQSKTAGAQVANADLDRAIKTIQLNNAKRVQGLRDEYSTADPTRQQKIVDEIDLLTGADKTKSFLPVPLKDESGNITGYQIFDTRHGGWANGGSSGGGRTGWDSDTGNVYVNGKEIGTAKTEADARKMALNPGTPVASPSSGGIVGARVAEQTFPDPLTGQRITAQEWRRKYGEGPTRSQTEMTAF